MRDRDKTKDRLVSELVALRQRISELEASETRHGLAEDARKQGEEWYRRIIETAYEGVWVIDAEWKTEYVNQRAAEMLGYTIEEMIGRSAFDFVYGADRAESERRLERRKRGVGEQSEVRLRRKDGSELWVLSSTNPILDESGKTIGVLGMITDITERNRAEERIRFQAQLLDAVGQAVIATDMQENIIYWNRYAEEIYGWAAREVMGRSVREVLVSEDQQERAAEIMYELKAGRSWSGEFVVRRKDGALFPVMVTDTPVHDEQGDLVGIIGVSTDISERKQAEKQRATQYAVSRLLAESPSLANSSQRVLRLVGRGLEWDYAGLWVVDPTEKVLRCISTWHVPSIKSIELEKVSRRMRFAKGEGQLGDVWASGNPVWIAGVNRRTDFLRRKAALSAGLRTGLGYPIKVRKKVVGVLELFSRQVRVPDKYTTAAIKSLSNQIGQFIERKRVEEELAEQMETLREQAQLLDLAHDTIMVRDMNDTITFWNHGAEEMYGWAKEEALGETSHSFLKTKFPKPLEDIEEELFREGRWEGELVHTKRDGTEVVAASRWALKRDEHGQPLTILEINRDITEHKQLKLREHEARRQLQATLKVLRESEARFKRLAEVNIIGVLVTDSRNITEANEAFLRIVGYTHEDLLWADLHCEEITPPEYYPLDELATEQLKRSGVCAPYKKEFIRKDGSRVPVLVGGVLFGEDQDNSILFVLDLTEREQTRVGPPEAREAERRPSAHIIHEEAREDLMAALQAMHDGQVEPEDLSLDGDLGQRLSGKELSALQLADARVRSAVADLRVRHLERERSFIRAAQPLVQDRPFLQAVEFLVELNRQIAPGREIQLTVEDKFPPEIPVLTRLELLSILKEALVNSRRHSEARCIWVALGVEENKYWAEVADDGQGFDTRMPDEGAGIAEMRESAHALGGELEVDSEPGRGTRVRVWVPF